MESHHMNLGYDLCEVRSGLSAEELWNVEKYFREQGVSEFVYDEQLDVLRFPKMAASPSVRSSQIGNGCWSLGTCTSKAPPLSPAS
jgi:hypothetical protein